MTYPYQIFVENKEDKYIYPHVFFIIRNIFNLSICAGVATSILMAQRWSKAEKEKREAETAQILRLKTLRIIKKMCGYTYLFSLFSTKIWYG